MLRCAVPALQIARHSVRFVGLASPSFHPLPETVDFNTRQGDPGSAEAIVALDDEAFTSHAPNCAAWLHAWVGTHDNVPTPAVRQLRWLAKGRVERMNRESREAQVRQDRRLAKMLSFSGRGE